jgi:hypothetical protein
VPGENPEIDTISGGDCCVYPANLQPLASARASEFPMTVTELKAAVMALDVEEKKKFILETLPPLAKDAMQDPAFLMQLFPVFLGIVKESGLDLQQLLQFATMMGGSPRSDGPA